MATYEHKKGRDRDFHLSKMNANGATVAVPATVKILDVVDPSPSLAFSSSEEL